MIAREAHTIMAQLQELECPRAFAQAGRKALLKVRPSTASGTSRPKDGSILIFSTGWRYTNKYPGRLHQVQRILIALITGRESLVHVEEPVVFGLLALLANLTGLNSIHLPSYRLESPRWLSPEDMVGRIQGMEIDHSSTTLSAPTATTGQQPPLQ